MTDTALIYAIAVIGLGILLGFTGQMSLAQAAFFGMGAYASAIASTTLGWSPWISIPFGAFVAVSDRCRSRLPGLRLSGHYLALATIGFGIIVQLVFINARGLTNGPDGINSIPPPHFGSLALDTYQTYFYVAYGALVLVNLRRVACQALAHRSCLRSHSRERDRGARLWELTRPITRCSRSSLHPVSADWRAA